MTAADKISWPEPAHPCIIIHGTGDRIVPIERSRKMAELCPFKIRLIEVDDEHRLLELLERIPEAAQLLMNH